MAETVLSKLAIEIKANTANFSKELKSAQGQFSDFTKTISNLANVIGVSLGTTAIFSGLKAAIKIAADFEAKMSEVRAITGASSTQFKALQQDALRLGAATKFTSAEVGALQVAYGRLGFTTKEILQATDATIQLSIATGEDLAKSADVAGSTVRGFGLAATETQKVVDVMAKSFNETALGLDNFTESMKYVAPVANAAGASVEETTALLGTLADAGIRGSTAGTSLRKIFTDMTKDGRPLKERLAELAAKGITLADSFDEVGRTAQTSLLILAKNTEKTDRLTESFHNVAGEAARVARIMSDNLTGDVDKLTSAWEGLTLAITGTEAFRELTQQLTTFITFLQSGNKDIEKIFKDISYVLTQNGDLNKFTDKDITGNLKDYVEQLKEVRRETGKAFDLRIVEELAEKYDLSSRAVNFLRESIKEANTALSFQEEILKRVNEFSEKNGYKDTKVAIDDYIKSLEAAVIAKENERQATKQFAIDSEKEVEASVNGAEGFKKGIQVTLSAQGDFIESGVRAIEILKDYKKSLEDAAGAANKLGSAVERIKIKEFNVADTQIADNFVAKNPQRFLHGQLASELPQFSIPPVDSKKFIESLKAPHDATHDFVSDTKQQFIDLSGVTAGAIVGIGVALGEAFAGVGDFGDNILKVVAGFAMQLGEILISAGTAMLVAQELITNPYTAIAAGVALVAIASAFTSSIGKAQKDFNSGRTGSRSASDATGSVLSGLGSNGFEIKIGGEFRIDGDDLIYIINRNDQLRERTTG